MTVYYAPDGLTESSPIGGSAFPGSEKTFVFTSDLFALPVNALRSRYHLLLGGDEAK